jgi:hypothetical protein
MRLNYISACLRYLLREIQSNGMNLDWGEFQQLYWITDERGMWHVIVGYVMFLSNVWFVGGVFSFMSDIHLGEFL